MNQTTQTRARRLQTLRNLVGILCIALVLLAGGINLLHTHAGNGAADNLANDPACSLCTLTHTVALPGAVVQGPVSVESVTFAPPPILTAAPARFFSFSLYVRPPPVETPLS
jgi:hypothetical protein